MALAMLCLRPCHYHMSANACDASQNSATSQQVLMCSKDTELYNVARSLGQYRVHCRHVREAVTTYRHNCKYDSKQVDVSTDDSCSLHPQEIQLWCCLTDMDLTTLPCVSQVQQSCLAQCKVTSDAKLERRSQVGAMSDNQNGA